MNQFDPHNFLRDLNKTVLIEENPELGMFFESAMKMAIKEIKKEIRETEERYKELEAEQKNLSKEYSQTGIPNQNDMTLLEDLGDCSIHKGWLYENLTAISEMRIINLFKSLEIDIKHKIEQAYEGVNTKQFYRWDVLIAFLKTKNISPDSITGYQETNQLRKVNNQIKHGGELNNEVKNIPEFVSDNQFHFDSLQKFLARVYEPVNQFYSEVTHNIYSDLYEFDNKRLDEIVSDYKDRMGKETITKLIEKLK